jgi:hypothetical protein
MTRVPNDTSPAAEQKQIELLRAATVSRRLEVMFNLSASVVAMARQAMDKAHPELDERAKALLFVEIHYGRELARQLKTHLDQRA